MMMFSKLWILLLVCQVVYGSPLPCRDRIFGACIHYDTLGPARHLKFVTVSQAELDAALRRTHILTGDPSHSPIYDYPRNRRNGQDEASAVTHGNRNFNRAHNPNPSRSTSRPNVAFQGDILLRPEDRLHLFKPSPNKGSTLTLANLDPSRLRPYIYQGNRKRSNANQRHGAEVLSSTRHNVLSSTRNRRVSTTTESLADLEFWR